MAETLVPNITQLVAHMSNGSETWANSLYIHNTPGGSLSDTDAPISAFLDFMVSNVSNNAFVETITGYEVFQRVEGTTNPEHPPVFQNTYHQAGLRNAAYGGSAPIGNPLPKDVCIFVKLATSGGRSGKMYLRNNLWESEVTSAEVGRWAFEVGADRFTIARFNTVVASTIADQLPSGADYADHQIVVCHLLTVKPGDTRAAFTTPASTVSAIRPVWNKAHR